ncbi:NUDIX hydrolase [Citricoccus muralis]|uniref:CoA pyrophosphatase n=1 Tax=Citricoccus muralis TaxID=169134 RepID=A0ABY8H4D0_9MICC|nr:CoA pyrophosphatase [Citricoccus muralis]WFP15998.1 CoA pyrophosphatase [Citricoccus muralis]
MSQDTQPAELDGALADLAALVGTYGTLHRKLNASRIPLNGRLPESSLGWDFSRFQVQDPRASAVLILFGALDDVPSRYQDAPVPEELDVLLTQRALTLRKHPGQISFPGGARDPEDPSAIACALREAEEETALDQAGVHVLGTLPEVPLTVSNFMVTPVVGWWDRPSEVAVVDRAEATRVFRVPVADLIDPERRVSAQRRFGSGPTGHVFTSPAFMVGGTLVWGFTAILLDRMLDLLGWAQPWQRDRYVDVTDWDATRPLPDVAPPQPGHARD